ncbi:hypothetical protein L1987_17431 [Smallanthus sonchifolius]|uniref:Uncharacterized protein n=1 Tax=Smallanthus sonchifolius TaxID=185202 RepID=A0ACB9IXS8_9ASTR|nr:hypothetical protein L1987_17431 [Smallanthus sonchifolius]
MRFWVYFSGEKRVRKGSCGFSERKVKCPIYPHVFLHLLPNTKDMIGISKTRCDPCPVRLFGPSARDYVIADVAREPHGEHCAALYGLRLGIHAVTTTTSSSPLRFIKKIKKSGDDVAVDTLGHA